VGHFVTTTTFDLLSTTLLVWLAIRTVDGGLDDGALYGSIWQSVGVELLNIDDD
jgi:hypothetical protein